MLYIKLYGLEWHAALFWRDITPLALVLSTVFLGYS